MADIKPFRHFHVKQKNLTEWHITFINDDGQKSSEPFIVSNINLLGSHIMREMEKRNKKIKEVNLKARQGELF